MPGSKKGAPDHHFFMSITKYSAERRMRANEFVTRTNDNDLNEKVKKSTLIL